MSLTSDDEYEYEYVPTFGTDEEHAVLSLEDTDDGDADDDNNNGVIDLPKIKMIWDCEKIEKFGSKNEKDEEWICHWCD
jgi:hypothetical protein